jgi:DNA-binding transcriptional regulator GbsR (MarR family)
MTNQKTMSHFATEADYWRFKYEELRTESRDDRTMAVRQIVNLEAVVEDLQKELQEARKTAEIKINIADLEDVQRMAADIELQVQQLSEMVQKMKCCENCRHQKTWNHKYLNRSAFLSNCGKCEHFSMWEIVE